MSLDNNTNRYAGKVVHMYLPQDWSITKADISKISNRYWRTDSNLMLYIFKLLKNNIDITSIPKALMPDNKKTNPDFEDIINDNTLKIDFDEDVLKDLDKLIEIMWEKMWWINKKEDFIVNIVNHFINAQRKNGTLN